MPWTVDNGTPVWTDSPYTVAGVTPGAAPTAADPFLAKAGVGLPGYYRASDRGQLQYNYYKDSIATANPNSKFSSDLTDLYVMKELNGSNDPFYLRTLTNLATAANVDEGTQGLANRLLYKTNEERKAAGLAVIEAPGAAGFTKTQPLAPAAFTQKAPTAPSWTKTAPVNNVGAAPNKAAYTKASQTGGSVLSPQYAIDAKAYQDKLNAYNASLAQYNTEYAAFQQQLPSLQAAYNTQNTQYQASLQAYQASVSKYQTDIVQYNQDKTLYDTTSAAQDAVLAASGTRAKQLAGQINDKAAQEEQVRKMDMIHSSLQGISKFYAGRAVTTVTPSAVLTKKINTLGGV